MEKIWLVTYINKERIRNTGNFKATTVEEAVKEVWKYAIAIESVKEVK